FEPPFQRTLHRASDRALAYLAATQRPEGSWTPLWFGNEQVAGEGNPVYGTARVLLGLEAGLVRTDPRADGCRRRAISWWLELQNADGGWGGDRGVRSSIEETGVVLSAIGRISSSGPADRIARSAERGVRWLLDTIGDAASDASPIGLYFARLWYYEELYPLIFSLDGLARARSAAEVVRVGADPASD